MNEEVTQIVPYGLLSCSECFRESKQPRWALQVSSELMQYNFGGAGARSGTISFGEIEHIAADSVAEIEMKSVKDRPPTPVV